MQSDSADDARRKREAAADAELRIDAAEVGADRDLTCAQTASDCLFRESLREQHCDLQFARCQQLSCRYAFHEPIMRPIVQALALAKSP
jgi:hypothetical protein